MSTKNPNPLSSYRQSFQDVYDSNQPKRQARQEEARTSMGDAYKQDITQYDYKSHGNGKFDHSDIKHLRQQGYTDDQISKYSSGLGKDQLSEGIRQNNRQFAGQHAYQDMAKGHKISDHDVGKGFNISDVKYLRSQGYSDKEIAKHAHQSVTQGGKRHGNAMSKFMDKQGYLDYYHGDWKAAKGKAQAHINNSGNTDINDSFNTTTEIKKTQEQNVTQDNDINTNIDGNNNYVNNQQDNSIRQYGGDNRTMVINTNGKGSLTNQLDGAATAGTLGGYWDVDDSPAGQQKRLDRHVTSARDYSKKYANTDYISQGAISRARQNSFIDPGAMDKRIQEREKYSRAKATAMGGNIFGDMFNMKTPDWNSAEPGKPVESPDFDKMYNKYTDF